MPPKKAAGKKGAAGKKKKKELEQEALRQQVLASLKDLKATYSVRAKKFVAEPLPLLIKNIDQELKQEGSPSNIEKIILNSMSLAPNDVHAITTTFDSYGALSALYIWRAKIEGNGVEALASFVSPHPNLRVLHLIGCNLTPSAAGHIGKLCRDSGKLKVLVLDHNPLKEGIGVIFAALQENSTSTLEKLSLCYCECSAEGADMIGITLGGNASIRELYLDGNFIGDVGLASLSRHIRRNTSLKTLYLAANQISNANPSTIGGPLIQSTGRRLSEMPPSHSQPPMTPLARFCASIASENTTLEVLDLRGNHVGDSGGQHILDMLKARKALFLAKQAGPLKVHISERMSEATFEAIWDLNDSMVVKGRKGRKGKR